MGWGDAPWIMRIVGGAVIAHAFWMTFLAIHRPKQFNDVCRSANGDMPRNGPPPVYGRRTSSARVFGVFLGYTLVFYIAFRWPLGFLPSDWGSVDEDGEFLAFRDYLSGLLSLPAAYLIFTVIGIAGDQDERRSEAQHNLDLINEDLQAAYRQRDLVSDEIRRHHSQHEQEKEKLVRETMLLKAEVRRIRGLVPPQILEEYDHQQREKASGPPRIYYD